MQVNFLDFSEQYTTIKDEVDIGLKRVFETGSFIMGPDVKDFENSFAQYCECRNGVGVNSGTDALYLALAALDVGVGDEIILPSFTFIATALCVSYTGATPVFVDVEQETYNIDSESFKKAITPKTKAVIPVHIYGQAANMKEICEIAKEHNIKVVEDACQAHGARYEGQRIGSLGDIGCFSFYPTKSLGAFGDGGIVVTDDEEIAEKIQMLRDYGRKGRYDHKVKGYNSRLDTVQAVVLAAKLKYLDEWNQMRADNAAYYNELLAGIKGVKIPLIKDNRTHVFQTYAVRLKERDRICDQMKDKGVGVLIHYPIPLHLQEAYKDAGYKKGDFPVSEQIANETLSLPMYPHITKDKIEFVCDALKSLV
ncbi:MAG: DegT/DnrJ/EryC1/StrS family aminotransferase [Candidatus Omnitrophica bacterium]|nr:DegT/DnrJ/EryC1/StrS family aminotransferase [Candidatus Omnitrophota bacterium]